MSKKPLRVTSTRRPKRTGNVRWKSATNWQEHLLTRDVEVTVSPRYEVTQKLDVLETMMRDLSVRIKATEDHLREVEVFPVLHQATSLAAEGGTGPGITSTAT